jgi:hypothetical protein
MTLAELNTRRSTALAMLLEKRGLSRQSYSRAKQEIEHRYDSDRDSEIRRDQDWPFK